MQSADPHDPDDRRFGYNKNEDPIIDVPRFGMNAC